MTSPLPKLNVIACQRCRQKKLKCDREKPACQRCCRISISCIYEPPRYGKRKHGAISGADQSTTASVAHSYIPDIMTRLEALEDTVRNNVTSPISLVSTTQSNSVPHNVGGPAIIPQTSRPIGASLEGYKFFADHAANLSDETMSFSVEMAISWVQTLYDNQITLGLLLPISKDFMLTIPSIVDNPYVQVDVRVLILYYGALHHGMLLSTGLSISEKTRCSLFFYRKMLRLMEQWQRKDQANELSLHVAFWMTHEAYSQLDFDLSHRLHRHACGIARDLGLLQLDADIPLPPLDENFTRPADTMGPVYRDVHRMYFWHILITTDYSFRHHLYRPGVIDLGTWKVGLPDFSTRRSLSNVDRHTEVYFEASRQLSLIQLKYSELETHRDRSLSEVEQVKLNDLLVDIANVLSQWDIERSLMQVSSKVNAWLYAHLIWRATSMIACFLRIQPRSSTWPNGQSKELEYEAAQRSIRALVRMFDFDQDGLHWNLGYFKCFFTAALSVLFVNLFTCTPQDPAASDSARTSTVEDIVIKSTDGRPELRSIGTFLRTLNHATRLALQRQLNPEDQTAEPRMAATDSVGTTDALEGNELDFLSAADIDVATLYKEPHRAVQALEKMVLTEPDPHRHWWSFKF